IRTSLTPYHDHNAAQIRPEVLSALENGATIALVSDAGTPLVSDPGYKLVRACREAGLPVTAVPGPSAVLAALAICGLPTDRFFFAGFPPAKSGAAERLYRSVAALPATLVFYESTKRLGKSLAAMAPIFGNRDAAVCRELTKLFEETVRGSLPDLAAKYGSEAAPKGEAVILIGPPLSPEEGGVEAGPGWEEQLAEALDQGLTVRDAADLVAAQTGRPRRPIYQRALALAQNPAKDRTNPSEPDPTA
ncbi:MAG: 16S rRNA (cytidine(1402)-2'-O)-methyltransferase, partial [Rhodospirillaceae bacterium]